jgi:putative ubiquitin-RnfH superfamily antitoxin RatB of RatAB toxin-antitoxin module
MPEAAPPIRVEVAYADGSVQILRAVVVAAGATAGQAIEASQILDAVPTGFTLAKVGIFGRLVALDAVLQDGDRVELYRPLRLDPKEARRRRAATRQP